MSANGERVQLFLGEREREQADRSLAHGDVCVRSIRSPDKQTDNEDSAAIIQLGDDSLVLAVADGVGGSVAGREASNAAVRTLSRVLTQVAGRDAAASPRDPRCRRGGEQDGARFGARRRDDARRRAARCDAPAQLPRRRLGALGRRSARAHQAARRAAFADGVRRRSRSPRRKRSRAARSAPRAVQRDRLVGDARRGRVLRCSLRCATPCCSRATAYSTTSISARSSTRFAAVR